MDFLLTTEWGTLAHVALPLLLLCGLAMVILALDLSRHPVAHNSVVPLAFCGTVLALWLIFPRWIAADTPTAVALWYFDRLAWVGSGIVLGVTALTTLLSPHYLHHRQLPRGEYFALLLFGVVGLVCMMATHHLVMIFVGIETLSIAAYVLAAYHRTERRSIEAGLKYFLMGAVASAFLLFGMAFLYGATGSLDLLEYHMQGISVSQAEHLYLLLGVAFILVGFAFKLAAVPFQWWAPDVYAGAPLPVTAFFATGVKAGAFIALWRVMDGIVSLSGESWVPVLWWIAVLSMTIGNLAALAQRDMKRMLAYSSIAHAGYALIALVASHAGDPGVVSSLLFYLIAYSVMTIGAFAVLIAISPPDAEMTTIDRVAGLAGRHPALAAIFSIFLLSLSGIPPTIGFFGKYYLFQAAIGAGETVLVVIAVLNSVASVAYYVRPVVFMYFRPEPGGAPAFVPGGLTAGVRAVLFLTLLVVLLYGLFPSSLLTVLRHSVG